MVRGYQLLRFSISRKLQAVNNTDINTRIGWYSKQMTGDTNSGGASGFATIDTEDASWSGIPLKFPLIQGTDCCGRIVAVGQGVDASRIGQRVLVRDMLRAPVENRPFECWTYGSDCNGGFAQFTVAPAADTWPVNSDWSDIELASSSRTEICAVCLIRAICIHPLRRTSTFPWWMAVSALHRPQDWASRSIGTSSENP